MRYAQLVMGPAGSGKSTYCATLAKHCEDAQRIVHVVNLDPAAEHFDYQPTIDIRELIHLDDAMEDEDLHYGPNGGLIFCMEYLVENFDWLKEQLGEDTDDYFIFDCPGQIELFTHLDTIRRLTELLQSWEFRICAVYLIDSQFMIEASKFLSGVMTALSAMVNLEIPHLNVLTKIDLLNKHARKQISRFLEPDVHLLLEEERGMSKWGQKYFKLSKAIGSLIDDYSLVKFMPLDNKDEDSIQELLITIDNAIQYGEDLDVKVKDFYEEDSDEDGDNGRYYS